MTAAAKDGVRAPRLWISQCPFCGELRLKFRPWRAGRVSVLCRTCGASLPGRTASRMVLYWNRAFRNIPQDMARAPVIFMAVDNVAEDVSRWKTGSLVKEVRSRTEYYSVVYECREFFALYPEAGLDENDKTDAEAGR